MPVILFFASIVLADLSKNLENGFLTPTYGILNRRDTEFVYELSSHRGSHYLKNGVNRPWQCFESNKVFYSCNGVEEENIGWWVNIEIENERMNHKYIFKTGWGKDYCLEAVSGMVNLRQGTSHMCFSGSFLNLKERDKNGKEIQLWEFMQIKSKNGSLCWFREDNYECKTVFDKKFSTSKTRKSKVKL